MGYQEVGGSLIYRPWKEWSEGDYVEGIFQKTKEDRYGKTNYILKVIDTNIPKFPKEKLVCLNANGALEYKFNEAGVISGQKIFVEYQGQGIVEKGAFEGKEFHDVKLMVDETLMNAEVSTPVAQEAEEDFDPNDSL